MRQLAINLVEWIRRYGLAVVCLVLPWSMPNTWPAQILIPWKNGDLSFVYQFPESVTTSTDVTTSKSEPSSTVPDDTVKRRIRPAPFVVQHLSDRVPFTLVTGYFYFFAVAVFIFSSIIIVNRLGWIGLWLSAIAYGIAAYVLIFFAPQQGPFDFEMSLLVKDLLDKADSEPAWKSLALTGGTGQTVIAIWKFQLLTGVVPLGMLSLAVSLCSIRPSDSDLNINGLKYRLLVIRWAIAFGSTMLIITVINVRVLLDWPLALLDKVQARDLSPLTNIMVMDVAGGSTLILLSVFFPAIISYILDVNRYRALQDRAGTLKLHHSEKEDVDDGLSLAPLSSLVGMLAILAPLLTSPAMDLLKSLIRSFGTS